VFFWQFLEAIFKMAFGGRPVLNANQGAKGDVVRRHRPDYLIVLYMAILMLIGLVTMYAIGPQRANVLNNAYGSNYSDTYFFVKQTISLLLALGAFGLMAVIPYTWISKFSGKVLAISLIACGVLFVAGLAHLSIAQESLGATRWFYLGPLGTLQPAEMLKFGLLVYLATFLGLRAKQGKINDRKETLIPLGIITGISLLFIVVIQKDLGTGVAITAIIATMLMVAGVSKKIGLYALVAIGILGVLFILIAPARISRVTTYLQGDNSSTSSGSSYQIDNAKIAIGTGGFSGLGIGNSVQATGYLPEATNDAVFAIMGEMFGFVGLVTILIIFGALLMRLLKLMDHLVDIRLKLVVAGVFGWFGSHVILNVAAIIGIFPLTGITLPLLSFGGTSMIFITAALGLVFQLSRYTVHSSRLKEAATHEDSSGRRGFGRTRYAGRSSTS
jgi:cell division protein FtsW